MNIFGINYQQIKGKTNKANIIHARSSALPNSTLHESFETIQMRCATTVKIVKHKNNLIFYIYFTVTPYIKIITVIKVIAVKIVITYFFEVINNF